MKIDSIFKNIPEFLPQEIFDVLVKSKDFQLERIVSCGQVTDSGWLNQDIDEWVILISGAARILFEGESNPIELFSGDYLNIPANTRHRVEWTDPEMKTVWLALHYQSNQF